MEKAKPLLNAAAQALPESVEAQLALAEFQLKSGQIDAVIIAPHLAKALVASGDAKLLGWYSDLDEYQFGGLFASPKIIASRRTSVEKFVRAYQKGAADFAAAMLARDGGGKRLFDPTVAAPIATMVGKYVYPSDPAADAIAKVEAATFYIDPQARLDVADLENQIAWYKSQGLVDAAVDPRSISPETTATAIGCAASKNFSSASRPSARK